MPSGRKDIAVDGKATQFKAGNIANPNGRPPKLVSHINADLKSKGYHPVNNQDITECFQTLINLTADQIKEIASGTDDSYPFLYRLVAKELNGKYGSIMLDKMLDRAYGKAKLSVDHTTQGEKITGFKIVDIDGSPI